MARLTVLTSADFPVIGALLGAAGLKLVDIGGRGTAFPPFLLLAPLADLFVVEPDRVEAERLKQALPGEVPWRSITVMTEAIAADRGEAQLFLTSAPGMSSLLEPDPGITSRYYIRGKFDIVDTMRVPTLPLDDAAAHYGFADAAFLKLDTQGTELEILRSGARLVHDAVLGVYTETCFQPFYKGQSLFADVDAHLRDQGFTLFSLSRTLLRRFGYRESLYSKRVAAWAHSLYFREPETLLDNEMPLARLSRLLGLALAFKHIDLGKDVVDLVRRERLLPAEDGDRLAAEFGRVARQIGKVFARKATKRGIPDDVKAGKFQDRGHLE